MMGKVLCNSVTTPWPLAWNKSNSLLLPDEKMQGNSVPGLLNVLQKWPLHWNPNLTQLLWSFLHSRRCCSAKPVNEPEVLLHVGCVWEQAPGWERRTRRTKSILDLVLWLPCTLLWTQRGKARKQALSFPYPKYCVTPHHLTVALRLFQVLSLYCTINTSSCLNNRSVLSSSPTHQGEQTECPDLCEHQQMLISF